MEYAKIEDEEITKSLLSSSILDDIKQVKEGASKVQKPINPLIAGMFLLGGVIATFLAVKNKLPQLLIGEADKIATGSKVNTSGVHIGYGKKLTFDEALKIVLGNEGGLANQKHDKGGLTNKGITQATYDAWRVANGLKKQSVKNISQDELRKIYHDNYWVASGADKENDPSMQIALFDSAVLYGVGKAKQWYKSSGGDFDKFMQSRQEYTDNIVKNDPTQQKFKQGWDNRTNRINDIGKQLKYEQETKPSERPTITNKVKQVAQGTSQSLLDTAKKMYGGVKKSTGWCAKAVHNILDKIGVGKFIKRRASAHDYIDELSKSPYFTEVGKSSVKAGDVVIYAKSAKHKYGHIFISDGGINSGVSDFSGTQLRNPSEYGRVHVFRINEGQVQDKYNKNEVLAKKEVPKVTPPKPTNKNTVPTTQTKVIAQSNPNIIMTGREPMIPRNT